MSGAIERAGLLRERRRHEEAVALLYEHLAGNPDDPWAHFELAMNRLEIPGQKRQALEDINAALAAAPESAFFHAARARILSILDEGKRPLWPRIGRSLWMPSCLSLGRPGARLSPR